MLPESIEWGRQIPSACWCARWRAARLGEQDMNVLRRCQDIERVSISHLAVREDHVRSTHAVHRPEGDHPRGGTPMRWIATFSVIALLLGTSTPAYAQGDSAGAPLAFTNVQVFDGEALISATTVVVENGVITSVGGDVAVPDGATVVDGSGRTLVPGLIDAHVHTFTPAMLQQALVFGVTTVFDMFTSEDFAAQIRSEQAAEAVTTRADMLSAGTLATAPGGHGTQFGIDIATLT